MRPLSAGVNTISLRACARVLRANRQNKQAHRMRSIGNVNEENLRMFFVGCRKDTDHSLNEVRCLRFEIRKNLCDWSLKKRRYPFPKADRKSTRLNSSHVEISYAVFC